MVMPYLRYNGDCEEAFRFYERVFNGKIRHMSRHGDLPGGKVMHAELMLTKAGGVAGADSIETLAQGDGVQILVHVGSKVAAERILVELSEGGEILGRFAPHPPPDDAGGSAMLIDRYGFTWILAAAV